MTTDPYAPQRAARSTKKAAESLSQQIGSMMRQGLKQREVADALGIKRSRVAYYTSTRLRHTLDTKPLSFNLTPSSPTLTPCPTRIPKSAVRPIK